MSDTTIVHYPRRKLRVTGRCLSCGRTSEVPVCRDCDLDPAEWPSEPSVEPSERIYNKSTDPDHYEFDPGNIDPAIPYAKQLTPKK